MAGRSNNFESFLKQTAAANVIAVVETLTADLLTPLAVYLKLSRRAAHSFLFESVEGGESLGRYSFIGTNPKMIVSGNDTQTFVLKNDTTTTQQTSLFIFLRDYFAGQKIGDVSDLPAFVGGAIGFFGFSCAGWFEKSLRHNQSDSEDAKLMFFNNVVAFDHAKQVIKIISLVFTDEAENDSELKNLYENAVAENAKTKEVLENQSLQIPNSKFQIPDSAAVESNWKREDFENAVREVKELIAAGECYQVVLSQCFTRKTNADAVAIYRALRSLNPSPYMFLLKIGEQSIIGASPEMLVKSIDRKLEYRPIAGTRRRGETVEEDIFLAEEMRNDAKEVAEHLMLVDLGRNDLGRVAKFGSVTVENLMSVEKYSHVQHLVLSLIHI